MVYGFLFLIRFGQGKVNALVAQRLELPAHNG